MVLLRQTLQKKPKPVWGSVIKKWIFQVLPVVVYLHFIPMAVSSIGHVRIQMLPVGPIQIGQQLHILQMLNTSLMNVGSSKVQPPEPLLPLTKWLVMVILVLV
ncbi:hypothetical protein D3C71_1251770 [compost metagenome]